MKKLIHYSTTATLVIFLVCCSKKLDLKPFQSIDVSQALNSTQDIQVALVGAYHDLGSEGFMGGESMLEADLLGDNGDIRWKGTYQGLTQIKSKQIPIDNDFVSSTWLIAYQVVNDVNNILSVLDKADTADRARIEGEALFIRATAYLELIRLYGKDYQDGDPGANPGVPIISTPTVKVDASSYVSRNTVKEVYDFILADLKKAENELPADNSFFAGSLSASAMLARVYLQQGDYANALAEADAVINSGAYSLNATYADEFPNPGQVHVDNTPEDIFAIQVTPQQGINALNEFYASGDFGGRGDALVTSQHLAEYETGDDRLNMINNPYTSKFDNVSGNVHIIRLAEMYLIRAEANFRLNSSTGDSPLNDINTIRARVNLGPLTQGTLTLDKILHERYLELAFESGFFLHDYKRLKETNGAVPFNDPSLVFPIPEREMIANKNLTQNEGY